MASTALVLPPLSCSLSAKKLNQLLTAICKVAFYSEEEIPLHQVREGVFAGCNIPQESADAEITAFQKMLQMAAYEGLDASSLEQLLTKTALDTEHQQVVVSFWRHEWNKIKDVMTRRGRWNGSVDRLTWRVDMKASVSTTGVEGGVRNVNQPTAIFEIVTKPPNKSSVPQVARFEVDRDGLGTMLHEVGEIQRVIAANT